MKLILALNYDVLVQVNEARVQLEKLDRFSAQEGSDAIDSAVQVLRDEVRHNFWELNMDGDTVAAEQDVADNTAAYEHCWVRCSSGR
jgi:hypothetical protein